MSIILIIASIACSQSINLANLAPVCVSDLSAPVVYAFDTVSDEALIIERFVDYTKNTLYRLDANRTGIIEDSWIVNDSGVHSQADSRLLKPDSEVNLPPLLTV